MISILIIAVSSDSVAQEIISPLDHRYEALEDSVTLEAYGPGG